MSFNTANQPKPRRTLLFASITPPESSATTTPPLPMTSAAPQTPPPRERLNQSAAANSIPLQAPSHYQQPAATFPTDRPSPAPRPSSANISMQMAQRMSAADQMALTTRNSTSYHSVYSEVDEQGHGHHRPSTPSVIHTSSPATTSAATSRLEIIRSTTTTATRTQLISPASNRFNTNAQSATSSRASVGEVLVFSQDAPTGSEGLSLSQQLLASNALSNEPDGGISLRPTSMLSGAPAPLPSNLGSVNISSPRPSAVANQNGALIGGSNNLPPDMPSTIPTHVQRSMPQYHRDFIACSYPPYWWNLYLGVRPNLVQQDKSNATSSPQSEEHPIPPSVPTYSYADALMTPHRPPTDLNVFSIPFPFQPYVLQQNAMNVLRAALEVGNRYIEGGTTATAAKNIADERRRRQKAIEADKRMIMKEAERKEKQRKRTSQNTTNNVRASANSTAQRGEYSQSESQVDAYSDVRDISTQSHRTKQNNATRRKSSVASSTSESEDKICDSDDGISDVEENDIKAAVSSLQGQGLCGVSILEAPTGTGKTHILLNSVLSWLSLQRFKGAVARRQLLMLEREFVYKSVGHRNPRPPEETTDGSWRNSDAVRRAKQRSRFPTSNVTNVLEDNEDDTFAPTDATAAAEAQRQRRQAAARLGSTFHDSSDSDDNATSSGAKKDDVGPSLPFNEMEHYDFLFGMSEDQCLRSLGCKELSTQVPVVKPKVWFSSRTHSQLQQCAQEMLNTAFGKAAKETEGAAFSPYCIPPQTSIDFIDFLRNPKDPLFRPLSDLEHPKDSSIIVGNTQDNNNNLPPHAHDTTLSQSQEITTSCAPSDLFSDDNAKAAAEMLQQMMGALEVGPSAAAPKSNDNNSNEGPQRLPIAALHDRPTFHYRRHHLPVPNAPVAAHTPIMPLSFVHIGSRQQLCINDEIKARQGGTSSALNDLCKDAVEVERSAMVEARKRLASGKHSCVPSATKGGVVDIEDVYQEVKVDWDCTSNCKACPYARFDKLKEMRRHMRAHGSMDLGEVRELGKRMGACPYYASRQLSRAADVIFIHFNYLIDRNMRLNVTQLEPIDDDSARQVNENKKTTERDAAKKDKIALHREIVGGDSSRGAGGGGKVCDDDPMHPSRVFTNLVASAALAPTTMKGDIIVFDEGHNVVESARNVLRADISYSQLRRAKNAFVLYYDKYGRFMGLKTQLAFRTLIGLCEKMQRYLRMAQRAFVTKHARNEVNYKPIQYGGPTHSTANYGSNNNFASPPTTDRHPLPLPYSPRTLAELQKPIPLPDSPYTDLRQGSNGAPLCYHAMERKQVVREEGFSSFTFAAQIENINMTAVEQITSGDVLRKIKGNAKGACWQLAKLAKDYPSEVSLDSFGSPFFEDNRRYIIFKQAASEGLAAGGNGSGETPLPRALAPQRIGNTGVRDSTRIPQYRFWQKYALEKAEQHQQAMSNGSSNPSGGGGAPRTATTQDNKNTVAKQRADAEDTDDGDDYNMLEFAKDDYFDSRAQNSEDDGDGDTYTANSRRIAGGHYGVGANGGLPLQQQAGTDRITKNDRQKGKETYAEFRARQQFVEAAYAEEGFSDVDEDFASENDPFLSPLSQNIQSFSLQTTTIGRVRSREAYRHFSRANPATGAVAALSASDKAHIASKEAKARRIRMLCYKYDPESYMQDPRTNANNSAAELSKAEVDHWASRESQATTTAISLFLDLLRKFEIASDSTRIIAARNDEYVTSPGPRVSKKGGAAPFDPRATGAIISAKRKLLAPTLLSMCVFPVDASAVMRPLQSECRHIISAGGTLRPLTITVEPIFPIGTFQFYPFGHIVKAQNALRVCTLATTPSSKGNFHFVFKNKSLHKQMWQQGCELILQLCPIVPEGLVIFFCSFSAMEDFWEQLRVAKVPDSFSFSREILKDRPPPSQPGATQGDGFGWGSTAPSQPNFFHSSMTSPTSSPSARSVQGLTFFQAISKFKMLFKEQQGGNVDEILNAYKAHIENNASNTSQTSQPTGNNNIISATAGFQPPPPSSTVASLGSVSYHNHDSLTGVSSRGGRRVEGYNGTITQASEGAEPIPSLGEEDRILSMSELRQQQHLERLRQNATQTQPQKHYPLPMTPTPSRQGAKYPYHRGAILTCVMGGRLSEGINFNDHFGRGVIVFGVPHANPYDAETDLTLTAIADGTARGGGGPSATHVHSTAQKGTTVTVNPYELISEESAKASLVAIQRMRDVGRHVGAPLSGGGAPSSLASTTNTVTSQQYQLPANQFVSANSFVVGQSDRSNRVLPIAEVKNGLVKDNAMKSVNQAIGRCIRHIHDHAIIVLCDERYASSEIRSRLPEWMKEGVRECQAFDEVAIECENFFEEREREIRS